MPDLPLVVKSTNPFVPVISLARVPARGQRGRARFIVFSILAAEAALLLGALMVGFQPDLEIRARSAEHGAGPALSQTNRTLSPEDAAPANPASASQDLTAGAGSSSNSPAPPPLHADAPQPQTSNPAPAQTIYIVKPGDTLIGIARHNGTTVKALRAANQLHSNLLRIGQKLILPRR